jgi:hypothetical protein
MASPSTVKTLLNDWSGGGGDGVSIVTVDHREVVIFIIAFITGITTAI